jgi:hypothetical protein
MIAFTTIPLVGEKYPKIKYQENWYCLNKNKQLYMNFQVSLFLFKMHIKRFSLG